ARSGGVRRGRALAEVAAVVVGAERVPRVPADRRRVRDAVVGRVARAGIPVERLTEEEGDDTGAYVRAEVRASGIVEQPLDLVVLVVTPRVVHRTHLRVPERDLPHDDALLREGREPPEVALVPREVGVVPPGLRVAELVALERGVGVAELREREVERRPEREEERGRASRQGIDLRVGPLAVDRILLRAPQ